MEHIDQNSLFKHIGARLKKRRKALKQTQEELAEKINVKRTSITNIESGNQKPPLQVFYELCHHLKLEINEVFPSVKDVQISNPTPPKEVVTIGRKQKEVSSKVAQIIRKMSEVSDVSKKTKKIINKF